MDIAITSVAQSNDALGGFAAQESDQPEGGRSGPVLRERRCWYTSPCTDARRTAARSRTSAARRSWHVSCGPRAGVIGDRDDAHARRRPPRSATPSRPGATALVVIDMQRDFIEPGGFGDSLGNDVTLLAAPSCRDRRPPRAWRARGWPVVHTREAHQPDLSDCPPAKRLRGKPSLRIGDAGADGPHPDRRRARQPDRRRARAAWPARSSSTSPARACSGPPACTRRCRRTASPTSSSPASPPKSACRPRCARPTTAATSACWSRTPPRATSPQFKAATIEMIAAQGAIVGWHAPSAALLEAL